ncbi:helix-turn-helix transcriptional regulator [Actinomadura sp. LCR2-06]|uniref:Helix-turn-helix transcriptional regulator n=2 Tax=Actinomadura violacea TaxID=2819934 RepID=A0ABS3RYC7_9ACTN|nr:helix-turn-helix transcriptional regulator [Actinomadura violacea]
MTQGDLAARLAVITGIYTVSQPEISRWETGKRRPTEWMPALATALQVEESYLTECPQRIGAGSPEAADEDWEQVSALLRRAFLKHGVTAAAAGAGLPAVGVADLQHITAALDNARRYADTTIVAYFTTQLDTIAAQDRTRGPAAAVPDVLALIAAAQKIAAEARPDVRARLLRLIARAAELAGWFYRDLAAEQPAEYWRDRAMEWAQAGADLPMQGYVLLKKAQAAWDTRDGLRMLSLAEAVQDGPWQLPAKVLAEAAQQVARGHALLGTDAPTIHRHLGYARDLLDQADIATVSLSPHYDEATFHVQVAHTHTLTGHPDQAIAAYEQWLTPGVFDRRDYGYHLAFKAAAQARAGDADAAARTGLAALRIARDTSSARTHAALIRLTGDLRPQWQRPRVAELRQAIVS